MKAEKEEAPIEKKKICILALGVVALATLGKVGQGAPGAPVPAASVVTRCAAVASGSVDGFASNQGAEPLRLRGEIRFRFTSGGAPSRPDQHVQGDVELPPGKPVQVARVRLTPPLREGEQCSLDVAPAVLRAP